MYTRILFVIILLGGMVTSPREGAACPRIAISGCPFCARLGTGSAATKYLTVSNDGDSPLKFRVEIDPGSELWLSLAGHRTEIDGCVPPGASSLIAVTYFANNLLPCETTELHGGFVIRHSDPLSAPLAIPAGLQITPAQDILLDPTVVTFGIHYCLGDFVPQEVRIYNVGCEPLQITGIRTTDLAFWLQLLHLPIVIDPGEVFSFWMIFCPLERGHYVANLIVNSDDPDEPEVVIPIDGLWTHYPVPEEDDASASPVVTQRQTWSQIKAGFQ